MDAHRALLKPEFVARLEEVYGSPNQNAFGSAVFFDPAANPPSDSILDETALARYRFFCGKTWEQFGEENWLNTWKTVYVRRWNAQADIVSELTMIKDSDARQSASMLLDTNSLPNCHEVLAQAFDIEAISDLKVFKIGDGQAMSGVLIAGQYPDGVLSLVFLMD